MNIGFKTKLRKNVIIKTFLKDFVSPHETRNELIVNCKKNREAPRKIIYM